MGFSSRPTSSPLSSGRPRSQTRAWNGWRLVGNARISVPPYMTPPLPRGVRLCAVGGSTQRGWNVIFDKQDTARCRRVRDGALRFGLGGGDAFAKGKLDSERSAVSKPRHWWLQLFPRGFQRWISRSHRPSCFCDQQAKITTERDSEACRSSSPSRRQRSNCM